MYVLILMCIWSFLSFLFSIFFILYSHYFLDIRKSTKPKKNIFIYRFNLFERNYFLEQFKYTNQKNLKDSGFLKQNKISAITNHFNNINAKKISEILNNLDNGSEIEKLHFQDKNIYSIKKNANYTFSFYKINKLDYFLILNFNYNDNKNKKHLINKNIKKVNNKNIIDNKKKFKGFIAFKMNENIEDHINKLLNKLNLFVNTKNMFYIKHNGVLILIIFSNKCKKIKKRINKIQNIAKNNKLSKTFHYLYNGSAIFVSPKVSSIKKLNVIFQFLSFLLVNSIKNKIDFLTSKDINMNNFITYKKSFQMFNNLIKNKILNIKPSPILNITDNNKIIAHYFEPNIKKMDNLVFQELINDLSNKKELFNTFAEIILIKHFLYPIVIHVYDEWLNENINKIKNNKVLLIIHFVQMKTTFEKMQFIKKINNMKICFIFFIEKCDDQNLYIVQKSKIKFILINNTIWSKNNFLSSDQFAKLIILNKLAIKNKIKIIYKNPLLTLDQEIYNDIGIKYYFKT